VTSGPINVATTAQVFTDNRLLPAPDILALQEADKLTNRAGGQHIARRVAEEMKISYVHAGVGLPRGVPPKQREWWLNFEEQVGIDEEADMGVALLSRIRISDVELIDLPWHECPWHPRVAIAATVTWRNQRLRVFNVHIDPHGPLDNQHQQTEAVLERAKGHPGPTVILGDFNSTPGWPVYDRLAARFTDAAVYVARRRGRAAQATWGPGPNAPRLLRIDHAFVAALHVEDFRLVYVPGADHRAVLVDVALDAT